MVIVLVINKGDKPKVRYTEDMYGPGTGSDLMQ